MSDPSAAFESVRQSGGVEEFRHRANGLSVLLVPEAAVLQNLRGVALNPDTPIILGTGQRPDIFMQNAVAAQRYYDAAPALVQQTMDEVGAMTGRKYKLFDYHGHPEADRVVVAMGSSAVV